MLMVFWMLLSGQTRPYLVGSGVVCSLFVTWIAYRKALVDKEGHPIHLLARYCLTFLPWLLWQIVLSNIDVAKRVWSPSRPISPHMVTLKLELKDDLSTVVLANSITLTPGTVSVSVDSEKKEILVHALTKEAAAGLQKMHDRVLRLEGR